MSKEQKKPCAADFMTKHVCTVEPETSLADVVETLLKHKASNAPVVEVSGGKKRLIGLISEADCLRHLANEVFFGNPSLPQKARTMMKMHPVCIEPRTELFSIASIFASFGLRHLPVVENDELVGIVSRRDILKALDAHYRELISEKEKHRNPLDLREIINMRFIVQD